MRCFILLLTLFALACSDDKPTEVIIIDNTPPVDEGVTRTFDISWRCFDCSGSSALKFCVEIAGYQELVGFKCAQDVTIPYDACGGKRYSTLVTCWKAR